MVPKYLCTGSSATQMKVSQSHVLKGNQSPGWNLGFLSGLMGAQIGEVVDTMKICLWIKSKGGSGILLDLVFGGQILPLNFKPIDFLALL